MKLKYIITLLVFSILIASPTIAQKKKRRGKDKQELSERQKYAQADVFAKGLIQKQLGNNEEALLLFDQALVIDPNDAATHYEISRVLLAVGRNDESLKEARMATELVPENRWYKAHFAKAARINEKYDDYVQAFAELAEQYPNDLNFVYELAFAYQFTGDYRNSIKAYQKIEELMGVNERITNQKTEFYTRLGEPENGVIEYEKLIESNPDDPRYYAMMAEYCSKNGFDDKAIAAYEKIVEINPDDPYVHISLADFYSKKGETEKSFNELKKGLSNPALDLKTKINLLVNYYRDKLTTEQKKQALELSEVLMDVHKDDPIASSFYASMLYENEEYEKASPLFREIVESGKGNYAAWEQLLFCDLNLEDYEQLAKDSEECIDYFPNFPLPYFFAGVGNFQIRDFVKAKAFLESGKDFVVNNNALLEQFYSTLGDTYNELENYEASYVAYEKVLKLNPENSVVLNNYAYYLSLRGVELDKAKEMAAKSVESDPYNSSNLDTYAWVLYKLNDFDAALEWIKKAYNNGGETSGAILEHYGDILYKLGQKEEALNFWERAKNQTGYSDLLEKKIVDKELYE